MTTTERYTLTDDDRRELDEIDECYPEGSTVAMVATALGLQAGRPELDGQYLHLPAMLELWADDDAAKLAAAYRHLNIDPPDDDDYED
jgi:hypothetical protein